MTIIYSIVEKIQPICIVNTKNKGDIMIELRKIDQDNFAACINIKTDVAKESFVDPVVYSLAEAWLYYKNTRPFAIYKDHKLIGFTSLYTEKDQYQIINFLIDPKFRNKGYGEEAALFLINYLDKNYQAKNISLPVDLENKRGQKFWQNLGFEKSKTIEDGYVFMRLSLDY